MFFCVFFSSLFSDNVSGNYCLSSLVLREGTPSSSALLPRGRVQGRNHRLSVQSWTTFIALALVVPPGPISGVMPQLTSAAFVTSASSGACAAPRLDPRDQPRYTCSHVVSAHPSLVGSMLSGPRGATPMLFLSSSPGVGCCGDHSTCWAQSAFRSARCHDSRTWDGGRV